MFDIKKYQDKLNNMSENEFLSEAEQAIWLSAYANNNPSSKYHKMADECYTEANRRGKPELYRQAWEAAKNS